jgi:hypothetical protein
MGKERGQRGQRDPTVLHICSGLPLGSPHLALAHASVLPVLTIEGQRGRNGSAPFWTMAERSATTMSHGTTSLLAAPPPPDARIMLYTAQYRKKALKERKREEAVKRGKDY